jgi:hypothetical protein
MGYMAWYGLSNVRILAKLRAEMREVKQIKVNAPVSEGGKYVRELDVLVKFSQEKVR